MYIVHCAKYVLKVILSENDAVSIDALEPNVLIVLKRL